ncbi:hypothetical protein [Acholeplasma equifetale]|uniref:hypothetical protein n=1 Tax=Acholeplasma equifetale TaxID=264634 RepID=UPI00047EE182|nr:hypothetical protein [Acholeplasma equifetale]
MAYRTYSSETTSYVYVLCSGKEYLRLKKGFNFDTNRHGEGGWGFYVYPIGYTYNGFVESWNDLNTFEKIFLFLGFWSIPGHFYFLSNFSIRTLRQALFFILIFPFLLIYIVLSSITHLLINIPVLPIILIFNIIKIKRLLNNDTQNQVKSDKILITMLSALFIVTMVVLFFMSFL